MLKTNCEWLQIIFVKLALKIQLFYTEKNEIHNKCNKYLYMGEKYDDLNEMIYLYKLININKKRKLLVTVVLMRGKVVKS